MGNYFSAVHTLYHYSEHDIDLLVSHRQVAKAVYVGALQATGGTLAFVSSEDKTFVCCQFHGNQGYALHYISGSSYMPLHR